jgi:hypothetical protein
MPDSSATRNGSGALIRSQAEIEQAPYQGVRRAIRRDDEDARPRRADAGVTF